MNCRIKLSLIFSILIMMGVTNAAPKFENNDPSKIIIHAFQRGEVPDNEVVDVYRRTYGKNPQGVAEATDAILRTFNMATDPNIEFGIFDNVLKEKNSSPRMTLDNLYKTDPMKAKAIQEKVKILESFKPETKKRLADELYDAQFNTSR